MGGRGSASGLSKKSQELKGTEKQVEWAKEIREKMRKGINILDDKQSKQRVYVALRDEYEVKGHLKTLNEEIREAFNKIDSAKWFIDNKRVTAHPDWYIDLARRVIEEKKIFKRK